MEPAGSVALALAIFAEVELDVMGLTLKGYLLEYACSLVSEVSTILILPFSLNLCVDGSSHLDDRVFGKVAGMFGHAVLIILWAGCGPRKNLKG